MEFADVVGEEPGVHQHQRGESLESLQSRAHALRAAPVLADDHETAQIELVDQRDQVGDMMRQGKRGVDARMVGVARADPIGND